MSAPTCTIIVPYYRQPGMLLKQLTTWADYGVDERGFFRFLIVDDASPEPALAVLDKFAEHDARAPFLMSCISLYRIDEDRPWNRSMARNLGTLEAPTEWIVHLDTDHVLTRLAACSLRRFLTGPAPNPMPNWWRFSRRRIGAADETRMKDKVPRDATNVMIHPHIDSYLTTKTAYWKAGGYNEDFTGVLGGGSPFLKEMERVNGEPRILSGTTLEVHTRHSIPDSSEHTLPRDPEAFARRKREIMRDHGSLCGRGPKAALRLPWHRVF